MSAMREWLTPYNYVQNNPVMRIDPTGLLDMSVKSGPGEPGDPGEEDCNGVRAGGRFFLRWLKDWTILPVKELDDVDVYPR